MTQDTLKVSSVQVSPLEIENILLAHPKKLVTDVAVAGVSGGRIPGEKVPRAWVVLSDSGKMLGGDATIRELEAWHHEHLSRYKWLSGGVEVVNEVRFALELIRAEDVMLTCILDSQVTDWKGASTRSAKRA